MPRGDRLGVDVGGTFTDVVALVGGQLRVAKVPSTPDDQADGVMAAIEAVNVDTGALDAFAHGMTVATNALLERRGARTALVTTEGFRDLLEIARQDRASLYDLGARRPEPLVPRELRFCVGERMGPDGVLQELDQDSVEAAVQAIREAEVEAVAVCLLFSFLHDDHERRVGRALREALDGVHVSLSCDVLPEMREYERAATTAADAYLSPPLARYLGSLADRAGRAGVPEPLVMRSSGGVVPFQAAARSAAGCVLSGPAGGVVGAGWAARAGGLGDVLSFDMGGTSTDVAAILDGRAQTTTGSSVGGVPLGLPMVDVHTVSAGGGSIAWADAGGALRVGPRSAGAQPGPAAYGAGGEEPTVTDANLLLGRLGDGVRLGGEVVLRRDLAQRALATLGEGLGLDAEATARGVIEVADAEMVRALRVVSVERGLDPRELALVAFGGAGGLHACALARELGMATVLVPRAAGMLSALGLAISDLRHDGVAPLPGRLDAIAGERLELAFSELEQGAREALGDAVELERGADLRYEGQSFELTVEAGDADGLAESFHAAHERRYGYRMEDEPVALVAVRVVGTVAVHRSEALGAGSGYAAGHRARRRVHTGDGWEEVTVLDGGALTPTSEVQGPALVTLDGATCLVAAGFAGTIDDAGGLRLEDRA